MILDALLATLADLAPSLAAGIALVGTFLILCVLALFDYWRICHRLEQPRAEEHMGKTKIGERRG